MHKETFKFNKKLKIILISIIVIALSISIYFILIGILNHIKTIKYTNLINSETLKFNSTNFEDSRYNYLKLYNKNINNTNDQNNYYNSNLIEPGNYFTLEINLKNTGKSEVQNLILQIEIPENCDLVKRYIDDKNYKIDKNNLLIILGNLNVEESKKLNIIFQTKSPLGNNLKIFCPKVQLNYFKENTILHKKNYEKSLLINNSYLLVKSAPDLSKSYIIVEGSSQDVIYKSPEEYVDYKIRLVNKGNMNAKNIKVFLYNLDNLIFEKDKNLDFQINSYDDFVQNTSSNSNSDNNKNLSFLEKSTNFNLANNFIVANISNLDVGQQKILHAYLKVDSNAINNSEIKPELKITCGEGKGEGKGEEFKEIIKNPQKIIVKLYPSFQNSTIKLVNRNGQNSFYSGDIVDALITIKNSGKIDANNVNVKIGFNNLLQLLEGQDNLQIKQLKIGNQISFNCSFKIIDNITKDSNAYCNLSITSDEGGDFNGDNYYIKVFGSKPFTRYVIPIVGFHEVEPYIQNPIELPTGCFDALCATLKSYGYQTITFADLLDYLDHGKALPEKPVILTSDDGYQDIYTYAFPILKKYGFKMTVFIITNYIVNSEKDRQTNSFDKGRSGVPVRPMLIWPEILEMNRYGCEFLSHTANHVRLAKASPEQIIQELVSSKNSIESHIHKPCVIFAWPYDNYSDYAATFISKAGYRGGVVYGGGIEDVRSIDLRKIKRVTINGFNDPAGYAKLLDLH